MDRNLRRENVGGVRLDEKLYKTYCRARYSGECLQDRINDVVGRFYATFVNESKTNKLDISQPIIIWNPENAKENNVIVSNLEVWWAARYFCETYKEPYVGGDSGIELKWINVFRAIGDENEIESLIYSYGHYNKPLDIERIAKERGYEKVDLYGTSSPTGVHTIKEESSQVQGAPHGYVF